MASFGNWMFLGPFSLAEGSFQVFCGHSVMDELGTLRILVEMNDSVVKVPFVGKVGRLLPSVMIRVITLPSHSVQRRTLIVDFALIRYRNEI